MSRLDLSYMSGGTVALPNNNPYEEIIRKKLERDFESFLVSSETAKVEQRVRELERQGYISVRWDKVDNVPVNYSELSPTAIKIAKAFIFGVCCGIGLMMLLL